MRKHRRLIIGCLLLAVGVVIFSPGGGSDCTDAPCDEGFSWKIWVVVAIVVLWIVAVIWFAVSMIRARRRD